MEFHMISIKKTVLYLIFLFSVFACERDSFNPNTSFLPRVVGYDLNCSTCILEFPYDISDIRSIIGRSQNDYYEAINLNSHNFEIGQQLECSVRKTYPDESIACITLYPSINYKSVHISNISDVNNLVLNDTLTLAFHDCLANGENKFYICLDSIVNESRCPRGLECFWAGMATVRFKFQSYQSASEYFNLSTNVDDHTILHGYSIKLVGLEPYPVKDHIISQDEYKAKLFISKEI
jgi:hypothetical protein